MSYNNNKFSLLIGSDSKILFSYKFYELLKTKYDSSLEKLLVKSKYKLEELQKIANKLDIAITHSNDGKIKNIKKDDLYELIYSKLSNL